MKTIYDFIVVGTGLTGAIFAEQLAQNGYKILIIDKRNHIAGNCYDVRNKNGIFYHAYGPHIFHTNISHVVEYLSEFTEWYDYEHRALGMVNARLVPIPFNLTSLKICFPSKEAAHLENLLINSYGYNTNVTILQMLEAQRSEIKRLAHYIYDNIFLGYTTKQWGKRPEELASSVSNRVPVHISYDDRYFQDTFQKMPKDGYTQMINRMLLHKNITILLEHTWEKIKGKVEYGGLVYTGTIDEYFNCCLGELPYRSLHFDFQDYAQPMHQPVAQVNYPNEHDFTRITEMAHLSCEYKSTTLVALEYPRPYRRGINEPYYPIPCENNNLLYEQYVELAHKEAPNVFFAGRLGEYKYYNMDQAVSRALKYVRKII